MKFRESVVDFNVDGNQHHFNVLHTLPDNPGCTIAECVQSWLHGAHDYTPESLCKFIRAKNFIAVTEENYQILLESLVS